MILWVAEKERFLNEVSFVRKHEQWYFLKKIVQSNLRSVSKEMFFSSNSEKSKFSHENNSPILVSHNSFLRVPIVHRSPHFRLMISMILDHFWRVSTNMGVEWFNWRRIASKMDIIAPISQFTNFSKNYFFDWYSVICFMNLSRISWICLMNSSVW